MRTRNRYKLKIFVLSNNLRKRIVRPLQKRLKIYRQDVKQDPLGATKELLIDFYFYLIILPDRLGTRWPRMSLPFIPIAKAKLNEPAPLFQMHSLSYASLENRHTYVTRSIFRLNDYKNKKNVFLIFLPTDINNRLLDFHKLLIKLNNCYSIFQRYDTEIILVSETFSLRLRVLLSISRRKGGLSGFNLPILIDRNGLLTQYYRGVANDSRSQTLFTYLIDKSGYIRHIQYLNYEFQLDLIPILKYIHSLIN